MCLHTNFKSKNHEIKKWIESGYKVTVDFSTVKLRFKRTLDTENDIASTSSSTVEDSENHSKLESLLLEVLRLLKETDRDSHFISVLETIVAGKLSTTNIALNLLLDLGQYLNLASSANMRYSKTSLEF